MSDAMRMENGYIGPTLDAQTQNLKNKKIIKSLYHNNIVFLICERNILPLLQILYCILTKKIFFIAVVIIELSTQK